jgi:oligoendopeptidase F
MNTGLHLLGFRYLRGMNLLPFGQLPAYSARRFVPTEAAMRDWAEIGPLFDQLEKRAAQCASLGELERWLLDWGELSAALEEEGSRRYIAMTCHTDNAEAEMAYIHYVEQIEPQAKPRQFALAKVYLEHPLRPQLPAPRYEVLDRNTKVQVELFREENVPLETDQAKKTQEYQKLCGAMTVRFRDQEKTLAQMARYLEEPDRPLREEAWQLVAMRRLQDAAKIEGIFETTLEVLESARREGLPPGEVADRMAWRRIDEKRQSS